MNKKKKIRRAICFVCLPHKFRIKNHRAVLQAVSTSTQISCYNSCTHCLKHSPVVPIASLTIRGSLMRLKKSIDLYQSVQSAQPGMEEKHLAISYFFYMSKDDSTLGFSRLLNEMD